MKKKRKVKDKTPEQDALRSFRKASETHVVTFELDVTHEQLRSLLDTGSSIQWVKRRLQAYYRKRLEQLRRRREYRALIKEYRNASQDRKKEISTRLGELCEETGLVQEAGRDLAAVHAKETNIQAVFGLTAFEDVWSGVEKVLYGNGKKLKSSWSDDRFTLRAKQANRGIRVQVKNGELVFVLKGVGVMRHVSIDDDIFLLEEEEAIIKWMSDKNADERTAKYFMKTGEIFSTYRPKYVTLKLVKIRDRWRVYAQVSVEGEPMEKKRRDGSPRFQRGVYGEIGVDIGVQSYAAVGANILEMKNLAERNGKAMRNENHLRRLQRHAARCLRGANPQNYTEEGAVRKGKKTWVKSKEYKRTQDRIRAYHRKCALNRKYAIQEDVNRLREHGSVVVSEKQSVKGWQKGLFGKSVQSRCPGLFRAELMKKFDDYIEVDLMYRASQYDHERDEYVKKELSQRTHYHGGGRSSPRDGYSSFLLWCHDEEYASPDRVLCLKRFGDYYERVRMFVGDCRDAGVSVVNGGF